MEKAAAPAAREKQERIHRWSGDTLFSQKNDLLDGATVLRDPKKRIRDRIRHLLESASVRSYFPDREMVISQQKLKRRCGKQSM
jgi:hypothetical protein